MTRQEILALADDIERRQLKFADVVDGHYEMPSEDEHRVICLALRKMVTRVVAIASVVSK